MHSAFSKPPPQRRQTKMTSLSRNALIYNNFKKHPPDKPSDTAQQQPRGRASDFTIAQDLPLRLSTQRVENRSR